MTIEATIAIKVDNTYLGEGALWYAPRQVLYWVDIMRPCVYRYDPATGENKTYPMPSPVGTVVVRESGGLVVALETGFAHLDETTGDVTMLTPVEADLKGTRFNDGKCDPGGRFWAGSIPYNYAADGAIASLYRMDHDLSVHRMRENVGCSNGIVWTADRRTMYYIDSFLKRVDAYGYDNATGAVSNQRVAFEVDKTLGTPDGMSIDVEDKLWIALYNGSGVCRFDPATGEVLERVHCPGSPRTTSCAFGGANLTTLYITSATEGMDEKQKADFPDAGALYVAEVGVQGTEAFTFCG